MFPVFKNFVLYFSILLYTHAPPPPPKDEKPTTNIDLQQRVQKVSYPC